MVEPLLRWFSENARVLPWRQDREPYHVWVSEIMLQQTRVEAVKAYYLRFLEALPTLSTLADAPEEQLLKLWEGLGYYSRVRNLQRAARVLMDEYGGAFPQTAAQLQTLPGIGPYTAGAVSSICFEQPEPAVDGNVLRVLSRLNACGESVDTPAVKAAMTEALRAVYPAGRCGRFTQALMELGATVCLPNGEPLCPQCPLRDICVAQAAGKQRDFPVRTQKKPRRIEEKSVFVLLCGDTVAVRKRREKGLLAGLWEFPNGTACETPEEAIRIASDFGTEPYDLLKTVGRSHIFTHIEWHMTCYLLRCKKPAPEFVWADATQLTGELALPTAFRQFLPEVLPLLGEI